ncbi:MAG: hypothetical protein RL662_165 [Bacteroidota bacterium]|jgi:TonB family protein
MAMKKEQTTGMIGTIVFHAILLICLLLYYIKPVDKERLPEELGGVPVMLGNVTNAWGDDEPLGTGNGMEQDMKEDIESDPTMPNNIKEETPKLVEQPKPTPAPTKPAPVKSTPVTKAPAVTQNNEKTIALDEAKKLATEKKKKEVAEADAKRKIQTEIDRKAKEQSDRKKNINSQMAGLFGNGTGSGNRGNTQGSGTQGSPAGNGSTGKVSGVGGSGTYDLGGRGVGSGGLRLPSYNVDDYGTVVVDIIVDPKGNVIESTIGRGTNTTNPTLRSESLRAARQTKFSVVSTTNNQKGTITYKFNLN